MSIIEERPQAAVHTPDKEAALAVPTIAGWFSDPEALHRLRYFNGADWTEHVTHYGPTPCSGCG